MRKLLTFVAATFITGTLLAGGLVTNTNQSASWVRLPARNASVSIDAAYYNPAGLMKLNNGIHISVSNQSIFQKKEIENFYKGPRAKYGLNQSLYEGKVTAPVFPSVYAVYKMDKFAFSFGFNPVGGGGGAVFDKGLPSFEMSPSDVVPALAASKGATAYYADPFFEGSSIFFGFQGGVAYKINDMFSVAVGLRYVTAKNTYSGYLRMISIKLPSGLMKASDIMKGIASSASGAATNTSAIIAANATYGTLTLAQAEALTIINATQRAQLEGGLTAFGAPTTVTIATADAIFKGAALKYTQTATLVGDQEADAKQTGSGFAPIFSVNITPTEKLNIGIKYEMATKLVLENKTVKDFITGYDAAGTAITMFADGEKTRNDMPAMISLGVDYKASDKLKVSLGSNYFFDKNSDYGHKMDLDNNSSTPSTHVANSYIINHNGFSLQGGLELNITDKLLVSGGYVWANKGVNDNYQSDMTYAQATQTFGIGGAYKIMENLQVNLGFGYTKYQNAEKNVNHVFTAANELYTPRETYFKKTTMFAVGVDYNF